jgi:hypothetical protein
MARAADARKWGLPGLWPSASRPKKGAAAQFPDREPDAVLTSVPPTPAAKAPARPDRGLHEGGAGQATRVSVEEKNIA